MHFVGLYCMNDIVRSVSCKAVNELIRRNLKGAFQIDLPCVQMFGARDSPPSKEVGHYLC